MNFLVCFFIAALVYYATNLLIQIATLIVYMWRFYQVSLLFGLNKIRIRFISKILILRDILFFCKTSDLALNAAMLATSIRQNNRASLINFLREIYQFTSIYVSINLKHKFINFPSNAIFKNNA